MRIYYFIIVFGLSFLCFEKAGAGDLNELIQTAYKNNPGLSAERHLLSAEKSLIFSKVAPDDPVVGVSVFNRSTQTHYGTITQKIRFPVKYYLDLKAQRRRVDSRQAQLEYKKLKVRERVISVYYSIYSIQKIIQLTKANMRTLKEYARVAEKKYSAGKSPQSDSMKAHFELTRLELDLIRFQQEEIALQEELSALLNDQRFPGLKLSVKELKTPHFKPKSVSRSVSDLSSQLSARSPRLKNEMYLLESAEIKTSLSRWEFLPDFQFQYQERIAGTPVDSYAYSIGLSFPLWFWKKTSQASAASAYEMAQEYRVTDTKVYLIKKVKELKSRVKTLRKTLRIYKTSLIPQAQGAYNSTRGSYRANKTSFLDLLDSERSLYRVKAGFYRSLQQYVKSLCELETDLGFSVSNLGGFAVQKNEIDQINKTGEAL